MPEVAVAAKPGARVTLGRVKHEPLIAAPSLRLGVSTLLAAGLLLDRVPPATLGVFLMAWSIGVLATDKYVHKYPYRFVSYVLASHTKAAGVTWAVYCILASILQLEAMSTVGMVFAILAGIDLLLSLPRRRVPEGRAAAGFKLQSHSGAESQPVDAAKRSLTQRHDGDEIVAGLPAAVAAAVRYVSSDAVDLPEGVHVADGRAVPDRATEVVALPTHLNDVRRINKTLLAATSRLSHDQYLVCRYRPLEHEEGGRLRQLGVFVWHRVCSKVPVLERFYFFVTRGRGRRLSRAEVWGRLAFCGLSVVHERDGATAVIVARKVAAAVTNRRPSYYPVVGLAKVGIDGDTLVTHKIRSMYPFSEFIQKQVFDANGLAAAGKIRNDFRVTSYGRYLRRYWLDEIPQLFDWLRGDIKLVGMRATSHHFLGLYPPEFVELYVRVKPGLVPPLFDEATAGFDEIVAVEKRYLEAYLQRPVYTDVVCLCRTLTDIALRGVRSN